MVLKIRLIFLKQHKICDLNMFQTGFMMRFSFKKINKDLNSIANKTNILRCKHSTFLLNRITERVFYVHFLTQYVVSAGLLQSFEFCPLRHSVENCSGLPIESSKNADKNLSSSWEVVHSSDEIPSCKLGFSCRKMANNRNPFQLDCNFNTQNCCVAFKLNI